MCENDMTGHREQWAELAAAEAVVMLKQLYADSPVSIHTDTDRIFSAVEDLV